MTFTQKFLVSLANKVIDIQKKNARYVTSEQSKGAFLTDVVSGTDTANEKDIRNLLNKEIPGLSFVYGEEYGFESLTGEGAGSFGALIDPIDGTRAFTMGMFRSSVSVGFVDASGKCIAGIIIVLNNQAPDNKEVWTYDGSTVYLNGNFYTAPEYSKPLRQCCISVTNVADYPTASRRAACNTFRLAAERSRGPLSFCSGAAEIMEVVKGNLGAFVNPGIADYVSHPVAIEIARKLGLYIGHVFEAGNAFSVNVDFKLGTLSPARDVSVVVAQPQLSEEIRLLVCDALHS